VRSARSDRLIHPPAFSCKIQKDDVTRRLKLAIGIPLFLAVQMNPWTQRQDIPNGRWHVAARAIDGKVYAIGGVGAYKTVDAFDPTTGLWETRSSMTTERAFLGTGVVNGKLYAIGGSRLNGTPSNTVEMYDPVTDTWAERAPMSNGREGICASVVDDKIFAFGGNNPAETTVSMYDPADDTWTDNLADMPTARWEPECVTVDDKIYVLGGFLSPASGTGSDDVEMYDPSTDSWTTLAEMPAPRGGGAVASVDGMIYYFGGSPNYGPPEQNLWLFDPAADEWQTLDDMPFAWFLMASAEVEGTVYLTAGSTTPWPHALFPGTYSFTPSQIGTGLESPDGEITARPNLALAQNFPNPFVSTTAISYQISELSEVQLRVFNVLGQEVHSADLGRQQAGFHQVAWDASGLEPGTYFYQIASQNSTSVRRAVVLR
jgi:N-acetylneuraminic acid mutarotase